MNVEVVKTWYVCQPAVEAMQALCKLPVTMWKRVIPVEYIETCSMCGVVIQQKYQGVDEDVCDRWMHCYGIVYQCYCVVYNVYR